MIRLSGIIRKTGEKKSKNKIGPVSKAIKIKKDKKIKRKKESIQEIQKVYEDAILRINQIMSDIKQGKALKGRGVVNLAKKIVERIRINGDILLFLINKFSLDEKEDEYLYSHLVNVSILAANLGLALGYDKTELVDFCASSLLHDIGMLKLPQKVITKPEKLTEEEFNQVKKHPTYGLKILNSIKGFTISTSEVIYQHHEKIDGTGYPEGRKGEKISEHAKIVAIADVYEALTHPRPYRRNRILPCDAVKMIVQEAGSSFDPKLVKVFLNYITCYPVGSFLLLNNNEIGRVIHTNENLPLRPVIEIVLDAKGKPSEKLRRIDLAKSPPIIYIKKAVDERDL